MTKVHIDKKRHIGKTITWRVIGSLDTFFLGTLFSGSTEIGGWIAFTEALTKTILYYFHERIWAKSKLLLNSSKPKKDQKRHILKTFSWRAIGTLDTLILSWIFTGSPLTGAKIALAEILTKMLLYYLHERIWFKSNWGVNKLPDKLQ